ASGRGAVAALVPGAAHELTPEDRAVRRWSAEAEGPHRVVIARRPIPVVARDDDVVAAVTVDVGDGRDSAVAEAQDVPREAGHQRAVALIHEQVAAAGSVAHDRDDVGETVAVDVADDGRSVSERRIGGERTRPARQRTTIALDDVQVGIALDDDLGPAVPVDTRQRGRGPVAPRPPPLERAREPSGPPAA